MNYNIIEEYIKNLEKNYRYIFSALACNKYDRKLVDYYLQTYLEIRYYSYQNLNKETILKKIKKELKNQTLTDDLRLVNAYDTIFEYVLYLEDFNNDINLEKTIITLKNQNFIKMDNIFNEENKLKLNRQTKNFLEKRNEYLKLVDTNTFNLKFNNINRNICLTKITHNIRISKLYSTYAVDKVFNEGITNEDKLFVEYALISFKILKDILCFNKIKHYILEFSTDLFEKKQKLSRLLNIIDNQLVKENTSFLFTYEQFIKYKDMIESLIKNNYQVSILLDDSFVCDDIHCQRLIIFKKVLISSKYNCYDYILQNKKIITPQVLELKK